MEAFVDTFAEFRQAVPGSLAFRVGGEVFPYGWQEPSLWDVIAQAREEPQARIATGKRGTALSESLENDADAFRALPLEEAVRAPVHLTLFDLGRLRQPGGALHDVVEEVYVPLTRLWSGQGLSWERAYPILFLSGPHCSTNYHWDPSGVLVVQLGGHKRFYALNDPGRWLTDEQVAAGVPAMVRPEGLRDEDIRVFDLHPGDALWSPCLAPHWVDADNQPAFTLSIAFHGIVSERV